MNKLLITALAALLSLTAFAQQYHTKGTKFESHPEQGFIDLDFSSITIRPKDHEPRTYKMDSEPVTEFGVIRFTAVFKERRFEFCYDIAHGWLVVKRHENYIYYYFSKPIAKHYD